MGLSFAETSACAAVCVRGCVCDSSPPPSTLIKQFYSWEGTGAGGGGRAQLCSHWSHNFKVRNHFRNFESILPICPMRTLWPENHLPMQRGRLASKSRPHFGLLLLSRLKSTGQELSWIHPAPSDSEPSQAGS